MKYYLLTITLFLMHLNFVFGQCPIPSFQIPDSICSGGSVNLVNTTTSTGPINYEFDFCPGDLENSPVSSLVGNYSAMSSALGTDLVFDGTDYYLFVVNLGSSILRFDLGNSPLNNPGPPTNLGNIGGSIGGCADLKVVKANGEWYGFVICSNGNFVRIDFGTSLLNLTPTPNSISTAGGNLGSPYYMNFYESDGHYYALAANTSNSSVTTFDFGTDITNLAPAIGNNTVPGTIGAAAIAKVCNNLYVFTAFLASGSIARLDFGTNFASSSATLTTITHSGNIPGSREIELATDNGQWYAFIGNLSGNELTKVKFGTDLLNVSPVATSLNGANGAFSNGDDGFCLKKFGTDWYGFTIGIGTNDIHRFTFPNTCFSSTSIDTTSSPSSFTLNGDGYQYMSLLVSDSTGDYTYNDSIFINPLPNSGFTIGAACEGNAITFTDTSTITSGSITSSDWDFGDSSQATGISVQHTYALANNYNLSLVTTSNHGCSSTTLQTIKVHENPTSNFSFPNNQCAYSDVPFTDLSLSNDGAITNWQWSFGDTSTSNINSPIHPFAPEGTYNVQLIVTTTYGCIDSISQSIQIKPGPFAGFEVSNTCLGETATFTNASFIGSGIGLNYAWNFGDTNTSTATNPTNIYTGTPSNYNVEMIVTASNGCTDTVKKIVHIGERPFPAFKFSKDTICLGSSVTFTDSSYVLPGENITARYWDFGDNTYDSISVNPTHTYLLAGLYPVKLTVLSPTYCDSTITQNVFVIESPAAKFTSSNVCYGLATPFQDISTTPIGSTISNWEWLFGDNDTLKVPNVSHTYLMPGNYIATLNIINSFGCTSSYSDSLTVYELPTVHFGVSKACTNTPVQLTDSSTIGKGTLVGWNWTFGDNSTPSILQNVQHTYLNSGAFPITLIATSSFGCIDSLKKFVIVNASPKFSISALDNCFNTPTSYQYIPIGTPIANPGFQWNFGDNTAAFNSNPSHTYVNSGTYFISLSTTDLGNACSTTVLDTVVINPIPSAKFNRDSACVNTALQLFDLSTVSSGNINKWDWTFGSHGVSTIQNPTITLSLQDSFPVKLIVQSNVGCKDSTTKFISFYPLPIVNFTPSVTYGGPPLPVVFTNTSNALSYAWDFGDLTPIVNLTNPVHTFSDTGFFNIQLTGTSLNGCVNKKTQTVYVLIPNLDLAIETISFTETNKLWQVKVRVRNEGNVDITKFELNTKLDSKSLINEIFDTDTILAGKSKDILFKSRFLVDNNDNPGYLCIDITSVNGKQDDDLSDNQKCITTGKEFQVFEVYPNPFNDLINFGLNIPTEGNVKIKITNINGQQVRKEYEKTLSKGYNNLTLNESGLEPGVYIIEIQYLENTIVKKIVRTRD